MNDAIFTVIAVVLIVLVPFDWYVAVRLTRAARIQPRSQSLNLAAGRSIAIAIAATIAGVLGFSTIYFNVTGIRLLPIPWGAILIALALFVISVPNFYAMRLLRVWSAEPPRRRVDDA